MRKREKERLFNMLAFVLALLIILFSLGVLLFPGMLFENFLVGRAIESGYECGSYSFGDLGNAVASSSYSSLYSAGNAKDGNTDTLWVSSSVLSSPHWIYFDLGSKKCVNAVVLFIDASYLPITIDVQVSDDALNWKTVASDWIVSSGSIYVRKSFAEHDGRYVRIYQKQAMESSGPSGSGSVPIKYGSLSEIRVSSAERKAVRIQSPGQQQPVNQGQQLVCTDSDVNNNNIDGKNYLEKGITMNIDGRTFWDRCLAKEGGLWIQAEECRGINCMLQEGFCSNGRAAILNYNCSGRCVDGKCVVVNNSGELGEGIIADLDEDDILEEDISEDKLQRGYKFIASINKIYWVEVSGIYYYAEFGEFNPVTKTASIYLDISLTALKFKAGDKKSLDLDFDGKNDLEISLIRVIDSQNAEFYASLAGEDVDYELDDNLLDNNRVGRTGAGGSNVRGADDSSNQGGGLFSFFNSNKNESKEAKAKNESSIGLWPSLALDTKLTLIIVLMAIALITALIIAYLLMPR